MAVAVNLPISAPKSGIKAIVQSTTNPDNKSLLAIVIPTTKGTNREMNNCGINREK